MTPIQLSFTAFGPFPKNEVINFKSLGKNPLFLINGPTGAGKTTILDAMCFALYGKTTGDERGGDQMRCDLAAADTLTEVVFSFHIGNASYRIRRVPDQPRPKARGEGFTQQSSEAQLWQLDEQGEPQKLLVSSKVTQANHAIQQLLGLSVDQFRQVMVLPQGQFRKLLTAGSAEREKIFSQLFQTGIYAKLEEALKRQALELNRELESINDSRQALLRQHDLEHTSALGVALDAADSHRHQMHLANLYAQAAFSSAEKVLTRAEQLAATYAQLDTLITKREALNEQSSLIEQDKIKLNAIERAKSIAAVYQHQVSAQASLAAIRERLAKAKTHTEQATIEYQRAQTRQADIPALQDRVRLTQEQIQKLERYSALVNDFQSAQSLYQESSQQFAEASTQREQKRASLTSSVESLDQWVAYQKQQSQLTEGLSAAQQRVFELTTAVELAQKRDVLEKQRNDCKARLDESRAAGLRFKAEFDECESAATRLERDWHLGQAAILSQSLTPGEPCPVCGSQDHPSPQPSTIEVPTQEQIKEARLQVSLKDQNLTQERSNYRFINKELDKCINDLSECEEKLKDNAVLSLKDIESKLSEAEKQHQVGQQADKERRAAGEQIDKLNQQINALRAELELLEQEVSRFRAAKEVAAANAGKLSADLPEEYRDSSVVEQALVNSRTALANDNKAIEDITNAIQAAYTSLQSQSAVEQAVSEELPVVETQALQARDEFTQALKASSFDNEEAFKEAYQAIDSASSLQERLLHYDNAVTVNNAAIDQLKEQIGSQERPDINRLSDDLNSYQHAKTEANKHWVAADHQVSDLLKTQERLDAIALKAQELDKAYAVVGTLSQVANGQTSSRVSLQRFVLSVLLDDVLLEASHRLLLMSKGRYNLLRKEERSAGNVASGLDLEVEDTYSGRVRAVETLSGGEGFMAALALALGLSEVVQAYAGGIRLDVLFIDEGFGSLDPESLDLAIQTLMDLQQGGRMIGIISHVAELKEQMPLRIDIETSRLGSRIAMADL